MKVQVEELSPIEKKLSIEVDSARVVEELNRAYAALSGQVKMPGFRQGKVPRRILEQKYREQVEDDVIQRVVQKAYLDAVREHKVEAVASPQVTNSGLKPNAPFSFEARVEVKPKVEAKDFEGLSLTKVDTAVADDAVNQQIENMRQNLGRIEPVTDRDTAAQDDQVTIDFEAKVDGKEFPGSKADGIGVRVQDGDLIQGNIPQLAGVKVGESKDVEYTFPQDYQAEEVRGKTAIFHITAKELKKAVVPELNDDFAKQTGVAQTVDELRAKVRSDLEKARKNQSTVDERDGLIKALLEKNPFDVPRAMVERAIDSMMEGAFRQMQRQGIDPRQLGLDFNRLRDEMREKATLEVKGTLLFEAIAQQQNIQASDEDVEKRIEDLAIEANQPVAQVKKYFKGPDERLGLSLRLREEKTIEFLKGRAKYS
ncbi:trigger factor [Corallococcus exiguus]|uniref:trigger factor n=1 Tax=Corallococcus TaxID=83461 RepID=UPI000EEB5491|nr:MULTISPECIES: trigger factor [Corallococcus]NNB87082.1 trigger factor [Corallococcus exiguus]NNB97820.1 trigger factor [Corallococcus exiguus]NNC06746.1 trigger factor [Corallococcus exiguus]NPC50546.1 trigger factor [Corallococcus exiguus]RKH77235.1 trigger factor [Corallococcus sp. AB032C]